MGIWIKFFATLALWIPLALLNAWCIDLLWGWYIVPILNAPALGIPGALGISLIATALAVRPRKNDRDWLEVMIFATIKPLLIAGIGWVYITLFPVM